MFAAHQLGVYIHWPFCASKCPYCDFNSHVRERIDEERWARAYERALEHYAHLLPGREVVSIFFGGGTPSLMRPETVERIISGIQRHWRVLNDVEITLEANPTSVEAQKFKDFRSAGVNRVSLGVQALNDADLKFFGREHDSDQAIAAIRTAGNIFDRFSFDLIYARPQQTPQDWQAELSRALDISGGHLSLYQLTIERKTPFFMRHERGEFSIPDDVLGAELFLMTKDVTSEAGMPLYEVSNHAAAGQECRHNLLYWHYGDYVGIGPGAHGRFTDPAGKKSAIRDHAAPEIWLEWVEKDGHGGHKADLLDISDQMEEAVMVGLRLREGISLSGFKNRFGKALPELFDPVSYRRFREEGWVLEEADRICLSTEGLLRLDSLLGNLLAHSR